METGISVLTPNAFSREEPYQIMYLLHGMCGGNEDVINYTMLPLYAQQYHCVFVMPNAVRSIYTDMAYGQNYFTYVAEELPRICKSVFHISAKREDTFIMGNSMGGYGALKCALTYPQRYAACCANAPGPVLLRDFLAELNEHAHKPETQAQWGRQFVADYRAAFGENFTWNPDVELLELAKRISAEQAAPRLLVTIGEGDYLLEANRAFAAEMQKLPLAFTYREIPGQHDFYFFDEAQKQALRFCNLLPATQGA